MKIPLHRIAAVLITALTLPLAAHAVTIDDFDTAQTRIEVSPAGPNQASSQASSVSGDILGFERDLRLSVDPGVSILRSEAEVSAGRAFFANASTSQATLHFQWDGNDGSHALDATGLGGVDLTGGNASDAFELHFLFDDLPATITLTVYTDGSNSSTATFPTTGGLVVGAGISLFMPFAAFSGSADFTNIGAIELALTSPFNGADIELDYLRTTLAPVPVPPAVVLFGSGLLGLALRKRRR